MQLSGIHILLTYQCTFECDHCFVWGSPWQSGTLTLEQIKVILEQAKAADVESIYFEGGEPFLYYALLLRGVEMAYEMGFSVGIVSNAYWAHTIKDALVWLKPLAGKLADLSVSCDLFHYSEEMLHQADNAVRAAKQLGIPVGTISVAQPEETDAPNSHGQLEADAGVMFRGRAIEKLVPRVAKRSWEDFTECPHEDLRDPGRVHLDPLGNLHICQGISIGNLFEKPLTEICAEYDPDAHPVCGPLMNGGPVALVTEYGLPHGSDYADACHLCYEARTALRARMPEILGPDQVYGEFLPSTLAPYHPRRGLPGREGNRGTMTGNDFVKFFLRTPLYIFMGNTMLITVTGRKTGKKYTTPVGFYREGDFLWVITSRDRTWWRNLQGGAEVEMSLRGKNVSGFAEVVLDEDTVASQVGEYMKHVPMAAKPLGIRMENGEPHPEDAARLAKERLFVRVGVR